MGKLRTALTAGIAAAIGVVTLRAIRERRRTPREEAAEATRDALDEASVAAEHAMAAAGHARVAGEKAVETARQEIRDGRTAEVEVETEPASAPGRLRRAGETLIRR